MDYTADKAAGQRTVAVEFGKKAASIFSCAAFYQHISSSIMEDSKSIILLFAA
jgi:1,4-dihydroxy-2-naphthoate octaprenyltransferase